MSHMKTGNRLDLVDGATFASLCPIFQYWSGLLLPSPGDIPDPRINPGSRELYRQILYHLSHWGSLSYKTKHPILKALGTVQSFVMFKDLIW